jgi:hypothetical protein
MPVFRLGPILARRDDPSWETSLFKEPCWTLARDEAHARHQLGTASLKMVDVRPGTKIFHSPWLDDSLTDCMEDVAPVSMREGIVWTVSGKTYSQSKMP